ncbi:MAG: GlcG protein [Rhodospirillaceae bacterium]|nr:GlcG protein [Rhodospirillaceae bacterium]|tara:strand:+ start:14697 stop:15173 length:477 start_codon:yes stop_codon:yes gene_type:complete
MANPIPLKVLLSLKDANVIVDEALRIARENNMQPMTIVVLDTGGHQIALKREDGSGIIRVQVACAKAYGALGMGKSSRDLGDHVSDRPLFGNSLSVISGGRFATVPGGVLILDDADLVIGAVGVTGDTSARDEYAAIGGIRAAGLKSSPGQAAPDWNG